MRKIVLALAIVLIAAVTLGPVWAQNVHYPPAGTTSVSGTQEYNVLTPSGGGADSDYTAVQNALNNSAVLPVLLRGGKFNVCHELTVPAKGLLIMDSARSGGDINYGSSAGPPASYLTCTGSFSGNAHIGFVGEYGQARGLAVAQVGSDGTNLTNGTISGTTLSVSPCGVLQLGQTITDSYGGGFKITSGTIVIGIGSCSGSVQTYTLNKASTVSTPEAMEAAVACAEVINNASWTTISDFYLNGCSGDGLRYIADSTKAGAQDTNGLLLRPRLFNGQSFNNGGDGIHYDVLQEDGSANVTDIVIDNVDSGANGGDGIDISNHTGGQVQITNIKNDFNGGACMTLNSAYYVISTVICDNNYNWYRFETSSWAQIWLDLQSGSGQYLQLANTQFNRRDAVSTIGIYINSNASLTMSNITNLNMPFLFAMNPSAIINPISSFQLNPIFDALYADTYTENSIEPFITQNSGSAVATLSSNTFSFDFSGGTRTFKIPLPTSCSPSPCVISSPAAIPPGLHGTFYYAQPTGGTQSTATFGPGFYKSTVPTSFTARAGALDAQSFSTDSTGHIILGPLQTDIWDGPQLVQATDHSFGDGPFTPGALSTFSLSGVGAGNSVIVRVRFCGTSVCTIPTATISSVTSTSGSCSQVKHGVATGINVGAIDHWVCPNLGAGSQTFTITTTGANVTRVDASATEFTKVPTSPVDDSVAASATDGGSGGLATVTSGAMLANDMAFSTAWWGFNPGVAAAGFTGINSCGTGGGLAVCDSYKTGVTAGAVTADSSAAGSDNYVAVISGYKSQ